MLNKLAIAGTTASVGFEGAMKEDPVDPLLCEPDEDNTSQHHNPLQHESGRLSSAPTDELIHSLNEWLEWREDCRRKICRCR